MRQGRITAAVFFLALGAGPAGAGALCDWLSAGGPTPDPPAILAADCGPGAPRVCIWTFAFRAPAARQTRMQLEAEISACSAVTALGPDAQVNHPDTFDAVLFAAGGIRWSLSLKDKSSLGQTFLFLRTIP